MHERNSGTHGREPGLVRPNGSETPGTRPGHDAGRLAAAFFALARRSEAAAARFEARGWTESAALFRAEAAQATAEALDARLRGERAAFFGAPAL